MSYGFGNNNINQFKAQAAYKDGGGMGGGGMYMKQKKQGKDKDKTKEDKDLFEYNSKNYEGDFLSKEAISDSEIAQDTFFNKFVNWFRIKN